MLCMPWPNNVPRFSGRLCHGGSDLNAPDRSLLYQPVGFTIHESKALAEHDHQVYLLPARCFQNLIALLNTRCHGLVQQDMFSRVRRRDCVRGMLTVWRADEDRVNIIAVYQTLDVSIALHAVVGRQLRGTAAASNTDQPGPGQIRCNRLCVRPAHETGANDSQSDFVHNLLRFGIHFFRMWRARESQRAYFRTSLNLLSKLLK